MCHLSSSSVFNYTSKPFLCLTICRSVYSSPVRHTINHYNPLSAPEDSCHDSIGWGWCFEFLFHGRINVAPFHQLLFALRCVLKHPRFIPSLWSQGAHHLLRSAWQKLAQHPFGFLFCSFQSTVLVPTLHTACCSLISLSQNHEPTIDNKH